MSRLVKLFNNDTEQKTLTVVELINILKSFPANAPVVIYDLEKPNRLRPTTAPHELKWDNIDRFDLPERTIIL